MESLLKVNQLSPQSKILVMNDYDVANEQANNENGAPQ
jgi:hypothetical protein